MSIPDDADFVDADADIGFEAETLPTLGRAKALYTFEGNILACLDVFTVLKNIPYFS